jgi:hypothetical protein
MGEGAAKLAPRGPTWQANHAHEEYSLPHASAPKCVASVAEATVTVHPSVQIDPETGIPDLIRRLADDSKRLASDEVRLAKLEMHQNVRAAVRGSTELAIGLGFGIVAAVALTVLLVMLISAALNHHYWAGALIVGAAELVAGMLCLRRGRAVVAKPSSTLAASRESLKDTAAWARHPARH